MVGGLHCACPPTLSSADPSLQSSPRHQVILDPFLKNRIPIEQFQLDRFTSFAHCIGKIISANAIMDLLQVKKNKPGTRVSFK